MKTLTIIKLGKEQEMKRLFLPQMKKAKQVIAFTALLCFFAVNVIFTPSIVANAASNTKDAPATVKSVVNPADLYVDNGTTATTLQKMLPKIVNVLMTNGTKSTAAVTWNIRGYAATVKSTKTYNFTGTVKGTKLTAKIKVVLANPYIVSIKAPAAISVANGTKVDKLNLPKFVEVVKSNKTTAKAKVVWNTSEYNGNVAKATDFTLKGDVDGTERTTTIVVKVGAPFIVSAATPNLITVNNGTTLEQLKAKLPQTVTVKMSNGTSGTSKVTWDTTGYNGNVSKATTYTFKGTLEGLKTVFTSIVVRIGAPYIASIKEPSAVTVENGVSFTYLESKLPKTVEAEMSNGGIENVKVTWDTLKYDPWNRGDATYTFKGSIFDSTVTTLITVHISAATGGTVGGNEPQQPVDPWSLVWSDEFDRTGNNLDSNGVNLNNWRYQNGTGSDFGLDGWGNNEQQYYSSNNIEVKNGNLVITPKMETISGKPFSSGRLWTSPTYAQKYGKFEARIKMPVGKGFWPAFWMMPKNDVYGGWASSGELDIMEARGAEPTKVAGTLHYGGSWPNNKYSGKEFNFTGGKTIGEFHTYSVEWEPGEIRWYVDGELYQTQNNWNTYGREGEEKYSFPAPFDQEFYIILNLAIGGNYVGNVIPGTEEFASNPKMEVDYVRVYDLTGRPYKTPVEPVIQVEPLPTGARVPDSTGNLVKDINFENGIKENAEGVDANFGEGWNFIHNAQFAGQATASVEAINGKNFAKINVTNQGTQPYSVQLEQHTTLGKGRWYEFSFDAKADKNRTLSAKLGGGPSAGWGSYSDSYTLNLTSEMQSFKKVFQMTKDSDILTRIEFNCATTTGPVWLGNVRLVEIEAPSVDLNKSKDPLPNSGNHVYNGAFDKYTVDRLAYWSLSKASGTEVTMNVPESTRELMVDITTVGNDASSVTVQQGGIQLTKNNGYNLTFKARAAAARTAKVKLTSKDGTTTFAEKEINLTTTYSTFELSFTMGNVTDLESNLVFLLGGNENDVYLDDVKLLKTTIDYTEVDLYPLRNGDFSLGLTSWETILDSGGAAGFAEVNGEAKIDVTGVGSNPWSIMLNQGAMSFTKGIEYTLSFRAKSTINRSIAVVLENATYTRAFDSKEIGLTPEWKTFNYTIKPAATEILALKYLMGKVDTTAAAGIVFIDDVVLQVKNPSVKQAPMLVADSSDNFIGNAIDITIADNPEWRGAVKTVKVNGQVLTAGKYTITAGNLNLAADNFATAGNYTILIEANGFANTSVVQQIRARDAKIVQNGTFNTNVDGWSVYKGDGSDAAITADNGEMKVDFPNYDGWWRWSTQVYQTGLRLEAGKTYVLKFDGRSTIAKNILIEINKGAGENHYASPEIALTTDNQTFTYEFTITAADTNAKLNFLVGSNNVPGENFRTHSIFLDNISIEEKPQTPVEDDSIIKNGTFDTNTTNWTAWWGDEWSGVGVGELSVEGGKLKIHLTALGAKSYAPQVLQEGFQLEKNKTYVVKFKAKADISRQINVNIGKGLSVEPYFRPYAEGKTFNLTTAEQEFTYEFTVTEATDPGLKMVFEVGKIGEIGIVTDIYLDDISIVEKEITTPVVNKTALAAKIAEADALTSAAYTTESWTALQTALTSAKAVNTKADAAQTEVDSAVTSLTNAINGLVRISVPDNTNLVVNGDFATAITPWTNWSDGSMSVEVVNGEAKIDLNGFGTEGWSVQFAQNGFNFEPNVTYRLTFKAKSTVARSFGVDIEGAGYYRYMDQTGNLTTEMKTYTYEFTVTKGETTKMNFFFGKTGADITDAFRSTPHTIYLDDVVIMKVVDNGGSNGGNEQPSIITIEAESATAMDTGFTAGVDSVTSTAPGTFTFNVNVPTAGTYKVTVYGMCTPNGIHYELRNSVGNNLAMLDGGPSDTWSTVTANVTLAVGEHTLKLFCAPGAGSTVSVDKITLELQ